MDMFTDCESLWSSLQGSRPTQEANLLPDLTMLRHSQASGEIRNSFWVPTADMVADGLTKRGLLDEGAALRALLAGRWLRKDRRLLLAPKWESGLLALLDDDAFMALGVTAFANAAPRRAWPVETCWEKVD